MIRKRFLFKSYSLFYKIDFWRSYWFTVPGFAVLTTLCVAAVLGLNTQISMTYQLFTFLSVLLAISLCGAFFIRRRLRGMWKVTRRLPRFASVNVPLTMDYTVHNNSSRRQTQIILTEIPEDPRPDFKTFLTIPEPGEKKRNIWDRWVMYHRWLWLIRQNQKAVFQPLALPAIGPHQKMTFKVEILPLKRGILVLDRIALACMEPFGLLNGFLTQSVPQKIFILPKTYKIPPFYFTGHRKCQPGGVSFAASVGDSEEFHSVREYRPGDPLRQIHWKSWAKTGKPIIKEFQDEFYERHVLVLDTFTPQSPTQEILAVFEEAVSIAASLVGTLNPQEALLDLLFVGEKVYHFLTGRQTTPSDMILEVLACVMPCSDQSFATLSPYLLNHAPQLSGCVFILLTWDAERRTLIRRLQRLSIPVRVLLVLNKGEKSPTNLGPFADQPHHFVPLWVGQIEEGVAAF